MTATITPVHFRPPADPKPWTPTPAIVEAMVRRIVERFDPEKVILFGSLARDEATADSDVDLLVVFREVEDKGQMMERLLVLLARAPSAKDVMVATRAEIEHRRPRSGSVLGPALREGQTVYDRRR